MAKISSGLMFFFCLILLFFCNFEAGGAEGLVKIWSDGSQSVAKYSISFGENLAFS